MPDPAGHDGLGRATHPEGVDWLDQPTVGPGAPGQEKIGVTVEQQDDSLWVQTSAAFFQPEVQARRGPAHGADLEIQHHQRRFGHDYRAAYLSARSHSGDLATVRGQRAIDLAKNGVVVGGDQYPLHG